MSFIYDDKGLVKSLIDAAEKHVEKFGQQRPAPRPQQQGGGMPIDRQFEEPRRPGAEVIPAYEIAQKLLYQLARDLGDAGSAPSAGAPIGVEGVDPSQPGQKMPQATSKDLRTLGDFLQWAAANKITWGGKRFAWTPQEVQAKIGDRNDPTQDAWQFRSFPTDRNDRRVDRTANEADAFADKTGLIAYLSYLRDSQDAQNNKVLSFMLATLIGEANAYLRINGNPTIDPRYKPGQKSELDPELVIDVVPDPMELDKWNAGIDGHPFQTSTDNVHQLKAKNLVDQGAFQAWFRNRNVKVVTAAGPNNNPPAKTTVLGATASDGDPCIALHILYKRAAYLKQVAAGDDSTVANYSKGVAQYLQAVTNFGKNYQKDGYACAVVQPGTVNPQQQQQQQQKQQQPTGPASPQAINSMVVSMPLLPGFIDFGRITQFFSNYERLINDGRVNNNERGAISAIGEVKRILTDGDAAGWPLPSDPITVGNAIGKRADSYDPFCDNLRVVVEQTRQAIETFYNAYMLPRDPLKGAAGQSPQEQQWEAYVKNQLRVADDNLRLIGNLKDRKSVAFQSNYVPHSQKYRQ